MAAPMSQFDKAWLAHARSVDVPLGHTLSFHDTLANDLNDEAFRYSRQESAAHQRQSTARASRLKDVDLSRTPRRIRSRSASGQCQRHRALKDDLEHFVDSHSATVQRALLSRQQRKQQHSRRTSPPSVLLRDCLDSGASSDEPDPNDEPAHRSDCQCHACAARLLQLQSVMSFTHETSAALQDPHTWRRWRRTVLDRASGHVAAAGDGSQDGDGDYPGAGSLRSRTSYPRHVSGRHTTEDLSNSSLSGGWQGPLEEDEESLFDEDEHHVPAYVLRHESETTGVAGKVAGKMAAMLGGRQMSDPAPATRSRRLQQLALSTLGNPRVQALVHVLEAQDSATQPQADARAASHRVYRLIDPYLQPSPPARILDYESDGSEDEVVVASSLRGGGGTSGTSAGRPQEIKLQRQVSDVLHGASSIRRGPATMGRSSSSSGPASAMQDRSLRRHTTDETATDKGATDVTCSSARGHVVGQTPFSTVSLAALRSSKAWSNKKAAASPAVPTPAAFALSAAHLLRTEQPPLPEVPLSELPRTPSDARRLSTASVRKPQQQQQQAGQQQQQWPSTYLSDQYEGDTPSSLSAPRTTSAASRTSSGTEQQQYAAAAGGRTAAGRSLSWAPGVLAGQLRDAMDAELADDVASGVPFRWASRMSSAPTPRRAMHDDDNAAPARAAKQQWGSHKKVNGKNATWSEQALARMNSARAGKL